MKVLVLALGNDLLGDDGAALKAADYLSKLIKRDKGKVEVIKTLRSGPALLEYLCSGYDYVIILDTIIGEIKGKIRKVDIYTYQSKTSIPHFMGLPEIIHFVTHMGLKSPKIEVYCIEITEVKYGFKLSMEVEEAAKSLAQIVLNRISEILSVEGNGYAGGEN